jgi:hypothetical protein
MEEEDKEERTTVAQGIAEQRLKEAPLVEEEGVVDGAHTSGGDSKGPVKKALFPPPATSRSRADRHLLRPISSHPPHLRLLMKVQSLSQTRTSLLDWD